MDDRLVAIVNDFKIIDSSDNTISFGLVVIFKARKVNFSPSFYKQIQDFTSIVSNFLFRTISVM